MDVDLDNFEEALALLEEHLPRAAFVAVDLEMTGIMGPRETQVAGGDVPQVQYTKGRQVVGLPYSIVQVGICLFEETRPMEFECRPFNVYVFPRPIDERGPEGEQVKTDPYVGLSTSSAIFLAGNGLDFQRWVTKGVSYTSAAIEDSLRKLLPSEEAGPGGNGFRADGKDKVALTRPNDIKLMSETMERVDKLVASGEAEMKLPQTNAFLALALRQRIAERHPSLVVDKRPSPSNPNYQERWVLNLSEDGWKQRNAAIRSRLLTHIGFRRFWSALKSSQRPCVFHNGFFDLLFLAAAFEGPLPAALGDFKACIHAAFPSVFDTKVLAESAEFYGRLGCRSSLPELAFGLDEKLQANAGGPNSNSQLADVTADGAQQATDDGETKVSFSLPAGFQQYAAAGGDGGATPAFHTAGYDAYETGRIFAYFRAALGGDPGVQRFENSVYLMFSAFQLRLGDVEDRMAVDGIVRYLYDIDTTVLGSKGLAELLKPLTEDGKRRAAFRWCSDSRSMLLIIHSHEDCARGAPGREACEKVLDSLLEKQVEQGRLLCSTLEDHLEAVATASPTASEASLEPASKRHRCA